MNQEEIEKLAENQIPYSGDIKFAEITQTKRVFYGKGYTQCQEDMADKKYTEEDMLKAFEKGALYGTTQNGNTHYFNEVINSLNKQD
jgi:hypothetical protein